HRLAVPPGVQVAPRAPGPAVPRIRGRCAGARRIGRRRRARGRARARGAQREHLARLRLVRRATEAERERLHETFAALCRIPSPSRHERGVADWLTEQLRALGLEPDEDDCGPIVGSDAGNLLARLPGRGPGSMLLCAHMDTVPLAAPVEPVLVDGHWENAHDGILGADNKTAVAVILELARRLTAAGEPPPIGIEILFTMCEEVSLSGSEEFDVSRLQSAFGFVFDHATPIGEIVVASPTHYRI